MENPTKQLRFQQDPGFSWTRGEQLGMFQAFRERGAKDSRRASASANGSAKERKRVSPSSPEGVGVGGAGVFTKVVLGRHCF